MDTIKLANKVIKDGIALLPDEAKGDFKASASDIYTFEAIANATGAVNENEEKTALLAAYAVQEANRVASTVWRLVPMPEDYEKEYRSLPSMKEMADKYNEYTSARKAKLDKIVAENNAIAEEERDLDIFKGIINGIPAKESEKRYNEYQQKRQAAMAGGR